MVLGRNLVIGGVVRRGRWWQYTLLALSGLTAAVAATVVAIAVNVATGGEAPWFPLVDVWPLRAVVAATVAVAGASVLVWWTQSEAGRRLDELVPVDQRPERWVLDRPEDVKKIVKALRRPSKARTDITVVVHGAGGLGKTTAAKLVRADRRILRRFHGGVYWVTLGRDVRTPAAIASKVNDLIRRLDRSQAGDFADPQQASECLATLLDDGPPRLLVLDDVWYPEQTAAFRVVGRRSARLITSRNVDLVDGETVPVSALTDDQAKALLTSGLPPLLPSLVAKLLDETGHSPLALRLANKILADQISIDHDVTRAAQELIDGLHSSGTLHLDALSGVNGEQINVDDPQQRERAVWATIEASTGLLTQQDRVRFSELAIFAEDEVIPPDLVSRLWKETGGLSAAESRSLCVRLKDLALLVVANADEESGVSLHDLVREYLTKRLEPERATCLHQQLVRSLEDELPSEPQPVGSRGSDSRSSAKLTAWWKMEPSARYVWDHIVEHLKSAGRLDDAESLVVDLRWAVARLVQSGPAGPQLDLDLVDSLRSKKFQRVFGRTVHLLTPTEPEHSRAEILCSRVAQDPEWGLQAAQLTSERVYPGLFNRWPLPDLADPAQRRTLLSSSDSVGEVVVAPNGRWLAAACDRRTLRVWDVTTGAQRMERSVGYRNREILRTVAATPDSSHVAAVSSRSVRLWDVETGDKSIEFQHSGDMYRAAFAPDGSWIAIARNEFIDIWELETGGKLSRLAVGSKAVEAMTVSTDGMALVCVRDGVVETWDVEAGVQISEVKGPEGWSNPLALVAGGMWLITMNDESLCMWDWSSGTRLVELRVQAGPVRAVAVAPDGSWLATADRDRVVRVWDVATGTLRAELAGHTRAVWGLSVGPDGTWLASAGADGTVRMWDVAGEIQDSGHLARQDGVGAVAVAPDSTWLASVSEGKVRIWDVATADQRLGFGDSWSGVEAVGVAPDGAWLAAVSNESVQIWDAVAATNLTSLRGHNGWVRAVAVAGDGTWLASAGDDGTVRIWDVATWSQQAQLIGDQHRMRTVVIAPDGTWLAASTNEWVWIWDARSGILRSKIRCHTGPVKAVAVAPSDNWLSMLEADGTVRLWDVSTDRELDGLSRKSPGGASLAVSPDSAWIATAGKGVLRVFNVGTGRTVAMMRVDQAVRACAWTPDGRSLVVGGSRGLCVFDFDSTGTGRVPTSFDMVRANFEGSR